MNLLQYKHFSRQVLALGIALPGLAIWPLSSSAQSVPDSTKIAAEDATLLIISDDDKEQVKLEKAEMIQDGSADAEAVPTIEVPPLSPMPPIAAGSNKTADEGIQIYVEKSVAKTGVANKQGAVKVYSPWPAKPLADPPFGWKFAPAPAGIIPFKTTVKLGNGNAVDLAITPFVLVPVSDGGDAIRIAEPGYDPGLKYAQTETVGTMLQQSTTELEHNEKQAADAIMRLQQLLSSLPQN